MVTITTKPEQIIRLKRAIKHSWYPDKILKQTLLLNKLEMEVSQSQAPTHIMNSTKQPIISKCPPHNPCEIIQKHVRGYLCRRPVISVVKSGDFIDLKKLSNYIKTDFEGIRGYMAKEEGANLKIESDVSEYMIAKCIDKGERVGKGNGPIDVENDNIGIDVACLCLDGNNTNEKSLGQKFKGEGGNSLDIHFEDKKHELALHLYVNEMKNKFREIKKDIYYFIFISTKKDIYLSILSINPKSLLFVKSSGFSSQGKSIKTSGFIDNKYGNVILYKSKKRLELRLNRCVLEHSHHLFTLS